jgi:hypothetical protein
MVRCGGALRYQLDEYLLDTPEISEPGAHVGELPFGLRARCVAVSAVVELE